MGDDRQPVESLQVDGRCRLIHPPDRGGRRRTGDKGTDSVTLSRSFQGQRPRLEEARDNSDGHEEESSIGPTRVEGNRSGEPAGRDVEEVKSH